MLLAPKPIIMDGVTCREVYSPSGRKISAHRLAFSQKNRDSNKKQGPSTQ
jgi:hypothetical protein